MAAALPRRWLAGPGLCPLLALAGVSLGAAACVAGAHPVEGNAAPGEASAGASAPDRANAASPPKYAAFSLPLSREHSYLRRAPALDFWALAPYYVGQQDDVSCSLASLTMLVNAARLGTPLSSEEPLVTQPLLRQRVASPVWEKGLAADGDGVTLDQLGVLASQSLRAFGVDAERVVVTHVPAASPEGLDELRRVLLASEASAHDWLFFNFVARAYVGAGDYGHIAPVGAYDAEARRVLILDPDRAWYEPYWIPDDIALAGMATPDATTGEPRGYLYVSVCPAPGCAPHR